MKQKTITGTLVALAIVVLLQVPQAWSAPTASASSLGPRQEVQQPHQQSGEPALTSLTVTADGTTQPLAPAFSSTVRYYTVVVDTAVTRITVSGTAAPGNSVAYQEINGTPIDDADTTANGHQVDIPTAGKRLNVVVTRRATATTYGVLVIHEGPTAGDTVALMALYNSAGRRRLVREHQLGDCDAPHHMGSSQHGQQWPGDRPGTWQQQSGRHTAGRVGRPHRADDAVPVGQRT